MKSISIVLKRVECIQTNESGNDELFVQIHAKEESNNGIDLITTCPKNKNGYWSIKNGEILELDEILFVDRVLNGLSIKIHFIEEDVTGLLIHKAIQELIDDHIGEITVFINPQGQKQIIEGKNTKLKEQNGDDYLFSMMGSGSHYLVMLEIKS